MARISVRQNLFADPQENICLTAKNTTRENIPTIQTHPFETHFKSLPNFGRWHMPPKDCGPAHLSPSNVQQLEMYNMRLIAESAIPAEACVPHTDIVVQQATEYMTEIEDFVKNIQEPVTQVAENVTQAVDGENGAQIIIGPNGTTIPYVIYANMNWRSLRKCLHILLTLVFDQETLRTHSMDCMSSHKPQLDPRKIADIVICARRNMIP